jgi:hypothetical protein
MKRLSPVLVAGILLAFLSFHACDRNPVDVDAETEPGPEPTLPDFSGTCDSEGGTVQRGTVSGTWTRNQSPHRVADTVYVSGQLVIEAGALVCLGPDAAISWRPESAGTVVAVGTAEAPVVFTADRPGGRWGGFVFRSNLATGTAAVDLTHVVIENATTGIDLGYGQSVRVSDGLIRRITGPGVHAGGIRLRNVVVDSVCQRGGGCPAVSALNYANVVLEDVWIRDSGGGGVQMGDRGTLTLANVRITGSAGTGLALYWPPGRSGAIGEVTHPIHITGGRGQPAFLPASVVPHLLPSMEAQERWTGNAEDVIRVYHTGSLGDLVVGPRLAWALSSDDMFGPTVTHLTMLPGARFSGGRVGRFTAEGTPEHPIAIYGTVLYGSDAGPSRIVHGRLRNVIIRSGETHALEMSDVLAESGYVSLDAPGSRLERVFVRGVLDPWPDTFDPVPPFPRGATPTEALRIGAADVLVSGSEISHSTSDGVRVDVAAGVRVRDSNVRFNGGVGLRNVAAEVVDARDNWWGDPAGPEGPQGNGVSGAVEYEPVRTEPVVLGGPVAGAITLTPSSAQIPAGDTAHFSAVVLDPSGAPLLSERIVWRSSDTTVAAVAGTGLVTGVRPGEATITAEAPSDPAVRATATVRVTPGAPLYDWTRYDFGPGGAMGGVWGTADAGIFVPGYGVVHHFDGAAWREMPVDREVQRTSISGSAPDNVWVIGHDYNQYPAPPVVFRYDGSSWHQVEPPDARYVSFHGILVAARDRVFTWGSMDGGLGSALWRYDGSTWATELSVSISTVWGRSRDDVYAGTTEGTLHFDGQTWTRIGGPASPIGYHGTATDLFALQGYSEHYGFSQYDGARWTALPSPPAGANYWAMAGGAGGIFACGGDGAVAHYDSGHWWRMWLGASELAFHSISVVGENVYLVSRGAVFRGRPR